MEKPVWFFSICESDSDRSGQRWKMERKCRWLHAPGWSLTVINFMTYIRGCIFWDKIIWHFLSQFIRLSQFIQFFQNWCKQKPFWLNFLDNTLIWPNHEKSKRFSNFSFLPKMEKRVSLKLVSVVIDQSFYLYCNLQVKSYNYCKT